MYICNIFILYCELQSSAMLFILLIKFLQLQPLGTPLGIGFCILLTVPIYCLVSNSFLMQDAPVSSSILPAPALASGISPRSLCSFYSRMVFRNQGGHQFLTPSLVKWGSWDANDEINCLGSCSIWVSGMQGIESESDSLFNSLSFTLDFVIYLCFPS